jgi:hypothetical protein
MSPIKKKKKVVKKAAPAKKAAAPKPTPAPKPALAVVPAPATPDGYSIIGYRAGNDDDRIACFWSDRSTQAAASELGSTLVARKNLVTVVDIAELTDVAAYRREHGYGN